MIWESRVKSGVCVLESRERGVSCVCERAAPRGRAVYLLSVAACPRRTRPVAAAALAWTAERVVDSGGVCVEALFMCTLLSAPKYSFESHTHECARMPRLRSWWKSAYEPASVSSALLRLKLMRAHPRPVGSLQRHSFGQQSAEPAT